MIFTARVATIFIIISLIGWGVACIMFGEQIIGSALLIVSALYIFLPNQTRFLVACTGLIIITWAGGRNLWIVLSHPDYGGALTNFGKSISIGSGLLLITFDSKRWLFLLTCICMGIFFIIGGVQHFIFIDFVKTLVPRWIPGDMFWSYVAGVGLIAAGVALITGTRRKLAALISAYMVFVWFLILHIPRAIEIHDFNEWISAFQALCVAGILSFIYHKS